MYMNGFRTDMNAEIKVDMFDKTMNDTYAKEVVDKLLLEFPTIFGIPVKTVSVGNVRNWIKSNVGTIHIREDICNELSYCISRIHDGIKILRD